MTDEQRAALLRIKAALDFAAPLDELGEKEVAAALADIEALLAVPEKQDSPAQPIAEGDIQASYERDITDGNRSALRKTAYFAGFRAGEAAVARVQAAPPGVKDAK